MSRNPGLRTAPDSRAGAILLVFLQLLLLLIPLTGCRLLHTAAKVPVGAVEAVTPSKKDKDALDPVTAQQTLLRFADGYLARMVIAIDKLKKGTNNLDPDEILKWKIGLATETVSIASGPNEIANLLDMTIFVTVTRITLEEYWNPKIFGESGAPLLDSCKVAETEIWQLTSRLLKPPQQEELRQAIDDWRKDNPLPENLLAARAVGMSGKILKAKDNTQSKPDSVFGLLGLDPLAGLDPATREIAQARLFAERALFVTQKMPLILRWQTELLALDTMQAPAAQTLVSNTTQITAAVDRFSRVAENLPAQLSAEREEIFKSLQSQETNLPPVLNEARQTLDAGTKMAASLNTTLTTFDALMKRFGVGEPSTSPPDTNSVPFRITDYTQTAAQLEATARQLNDLLLTLDRTIGSTNLTKLSAQAAPVVEQAQASGKQIVTYAFWRLLVVVLVVLIAALIYRIVCSRMTRSERSA